MSREQKLVWWLMGTFAGILIIGGGAWANSINLKVEKIAPMEVNVQYIQKDISEIKSMVKELIK